MEAARAAKIGLGSLFGAYLAYKTYPTLKEWDVLPFAKSEAYKKGEAMMDFSKLDGIIYDSYDKGFQPPRSEMLPTSRGQMIIK